MSQPAPTVVIVDDHAGFRRAARELLGRGGLAVIGEAGDAATAYAAVLDLAPDVVLVDVRLPGEDGIDLARRLARLPRPPAVVLTSSRDRAVYAARIAESPARGFIAKSRLTAHALRALLP